MNYRLYCFFFLAVLSLLFFESCKPAKEKALNPEKARIDSLEEAMRLATEKNPGEPDLNLAMHLAKEYQNYEAGHPADSLSPRYLFKAGQVIENVFDDKKRAAEIYYDVYRKYPKSGAAPYALFMTGNLFHSIRDSTHAIEMLNFFLAKYPDHKLKSDAAVLIKSLGGEADTSSRPSKPIPF
jgi:hypothetical protein